MNNMGLSDIEYALMCFFWESSKPQSFGEVLRFCNDVQKLDWAKTTAHTYLTRMIKKGLLGCNNQKGTRRTYYARLSRDELAQNTAQEFLAGNFNGSLKSLLVSLSHNASLSREEADELHELLDHMVRPDSDSEN